MTGSRRASCRSSSFYLAASSDCGGLYKSFIQASLPLRTGSMRGQMAEIGMRCWVFLPRKVKFARLYHARRRSSSRRVGEDGWESGLGEPPFPCTGQPAPHSRFSRPRFSPMPVARCPSPVARCPLPVAGLPILPSWPTPRAVQSRAVFVPRHSTAIVVGSPCSVGQPVSAHGCIFVCQDCGFDKAPSLLAATPHEMYSQRHAFSLRSLPMQDSTSPKTRYPHVSTSPRIVLPPPTPHKELRGFVPPLRADDGHGIQTQPFRLVVGVLELAVPAHPLPTLP